MGSPFIYLHLQNILCILSILQDNVVGDGFREYFTKRLEEIVKTLPHQDYSPLVLGECELPASQELVFDCPPDCFIEIVPSEVGVIETITSDYVIVMNISTKSIRINQYCGDYIDVDPDEILIFDGTVDSVVVKMR